MATMQDVVDRARIPLNDATKVRYADATLLAFLNAGVSRTYAIRPVQRRHQEQIPTDADRKRPTPIDDP